MLPGGRPERDCCEQRAEAELSGREGGTTTKAGKCIPIHRSFSITIIISNGNGNGNAVGERGADSLPRWRVAFLASTGAFPT